MPWQDEPCAVIATGERQCVVGDAVWHIDCSNTKTCKSENLICIGWDGGNHEAKVKAFLVLREAGTHYRCISQSSK